MHEFTNSGEFAQTIGVNFPEKKQADTTPPRRPNTAAFIEVDPPTFDLPTPGLPYSFPVSALPAKFRQIVTDLSQGLNFPPDYTAAAMLAAVAAAMRKKWRLQVIPGWVEYSNIYLALVGDPRAGKTHPLRWIFRPLQEMDTTAFEAFEAERLIWEGLPEDEKRGKPEPFPVACLVEDTTVESLQDVLKENPLGLTLQTDELAAWFNSFTRYSRGGNDKAFWLKVFNNLGATITRKTARKKLPEIFLSVVGTIQPEVLAECVEALKLEADGLLQRMLFANLPNAKKNYLPYGTASNQTGQTWAAIIQEVINTPAPDLVYISPEADKIRRIFNRETTDRINLDHTPPLVQEVLGKFDNHLHRIALILHVMNGGGPQITGETMEGAGNICLYFIASAFDLMGKRDKLVKPSDLDPATVAALVKEVGQVKAAARLGISRGSVQGLVKKFEQGGKGAANG